MTDHEQYMTVEEAAAHLRIGTRQVHRYGENKRLRTIKIGKRVLFHRGDVQQLGAELDVTRRPEPTQKPTMRAEIVPASDLMERLWEREQQINQMSMTIGALQAQLESRLLPDAARQLEHDLIRAQAERDMLKDQIELLRTDLERERERRIAETERPPWWKRLFS
jgi:excisionase family DNA binding protein